VEVAPNHKALTYMIGLLWLLLRGRFEIRPVAWLNPGSIALMKALETNFPSASQVLIVGLSSLPFRLISVAVC
jgi:hypothetical protein